ncbi:bacterial low temperature requirement A protein-domain-containing protein [Cadophora sp. MPI-SDFR-AT-0126]|nr:bacterial low temperature requirement A protein-domain-containing protein [Leotiomycetes sp. MPI-SDFR-AT-0126]
MSQLHLPIFKSPLEAITPYSSTDKVEPGEINREIDEFMNEPVFKHYEESTNLQLFFDLFFVANLASFNDKHEVNSQASLGTYVGFFCVLWFTWCQVTLCDVRFITDSVSERLAHACHFGVMVGLAVVGPQFSELDHDTPWGLMRKLSIVLIVSRTVLIFQYGTVLVFVWKYKKSRLPLITTMLTLLVAVSVYVAIYIALVYQTSPLLYIGWYMVFVFEAVSSIAIAARWQVLSFEGTHLIERMSCLSLIILGEGVIGVCKSIVKIEKYDNTFSSAAIGGITCSVLIIYLVYILYFDNIHEGKSTSIRQHIWACLHFPFHVTLVLLTEGASQFVAWRHTIEYVKDTFDGVDYLTIADAPNTTEAFAALSSTMNTVIFDGLFPVSLHDAKVAELDLQILGDNSSTPAQSSLAIGEIQVLLFRTVFDAYGFEPAKIPPAIGEDSSADILAIYDAYLTVFKFLFGYFFTCGGLTLIWIGVLSWLSMSNLEYRARWRFVAIATNILLGVGLCLLTLLILTDAALTLGTSPWTITICVFVFMIAIIVDQVVKNKMHRFQGE